MLGVRLFVPAQVLAQSIRYRHRAGGDWGETVEQGIETTFVMF